MRGLCVLLLLNSSLDSASLSSFALLFAALFALQLSTTTFGHDSLLVAIRSVAFFRSQPSTTAPIAVKR